MQLRGRTALATGGLGQAIARRLRVEGCALTRTGDCAGVEVLVANAGIACKLAEGHKDKR